MTLTRNKKLVIAVVGIVLCVSALELFLFNFRYFYTKLSGMREHTIGAAEFTELDGCEYDPEKGVISVSTKNASFMINPDIPISAVRLNFSGNYNYFFVRYDFSDESYRNWSHRGANLEVQFKDSHYATVVTAGKCLSLRVNLSDIMGDNIEISSVTLNAPYFNFNLYRVFAVFLIATVVCLFKIFRLSEIKLDLKQPKQLQIFYLSILLMVLVCVVFHTLEAQVLVNDPYQMLTTAFFNGQTHFIPEDAMPPFPTGISPYDPSQRSGSGHPYMYDSAYFNGKYYCYYGPAPVITLMLPFRLLTGGNLSTQAATLIFTALFFVVFLKLLALMAEKWCGGISLGAFLLCSMGAAFATHALFCLSRSSFYELPYASGLFYYFTGIYLLFFQYARLRVNNLAMLLSGLCFGLAAASRPTLIFYMPAAVPLLCGIHFSALKPRFQRGTLKETLNSLRRYFPCNLLWFILPLAAVAALMMIYNYARFGSPTDFGSDYNISMSDLHYNKITDFSKYFDAVYYFYLKLPEVSMVAPFLKAPPVRDQNYTQYLYVSWSVGLITFPFTWIILFARSLLKGPGRVQKSLIYILIITGLLMPFLLITLGGAHMRYLMDILPYLSLASALLWLRLLLMAEKTQIKQPVAMAFCVAVISTVIITTFLTMSGENGILVNKWADINYELTRAIEFWR